MRLRSKGPESASRFLACTRLGMVVLAAIGLARSHLVAAEDRAAAPEDASRSGDSATDPSSRDGSASSSPTQATVTEGYRLLEADDLSGAERVFAALLEADANDLAAREGLAWTYFALGDHERAAAEADVRLGREAVDSEWYEHWLLIVSHASSRRDDAISGYLALVARRPGDPVPRTRLAEVLSWSPDRLDEAAALYGEVLEASPENRQALLGLGRTLAWAERWVDAAAVFDRLLDLDPDDSEALMERFQVARASGDWDAAMTLLEESSSREPQVEQMPMTPAEILVTSAVLSAERRVSTERQRTAALAAALDEEARAAARPRVQVIETFSRERSRLLRSALELESTVPLWEGADLAIGAEWTRLSEADDLLDRYALGLGMAQSLPAGFRLYADYAGQIGPEISTVHTLNAMVAVAPPGIPLEVKGGVRRRSMSDTVLGYEGIALLRNAGANGMSPESMRLGIAIEEVVAAVSAAPVPGGYVYAQGELGRVTDDNLRRAVATGAGLDLFETLTTVRSHRLTLRYDFIYFAFQQTSTDYYTDPDFQLHVPSLEWQWRSSVAIVGLEAGLSVRRDIPLGYSAGGFFRAPAAGQWYIQGRTRYSDDTRYAIVAATLGVGVRFGR